MTSTLDRDFPGPEMRPASRQPRAAMAARSQQQPYPARREPRWQPRR